MAAFELRPGLRWSRGPRRYRSWRAGLLACLPELSPRGHLHAALMDSLDFYDETDCNVEAPIIEGELANSSTRAHWTLIGG